MSQASRAFRSGLTVGFLRILCNDKDFTLRERNKYVELDARMNPTLSHYNECPLLYIFFCVGLEMSCCSTTESPSFPRLDHADSSKKPPVWNRSDGCHQCLRLRPYHHCRNVDNPENFADCMKGIILFL